MFGSLGMGEMIVIFLVVLLLFGAKRLPESGSSLGKGIREFKGSIREIEKEVRAVDEPEDKQDKIVPPAPVSSDEPDQGPRRLTTNPPPSEQQIGGVPTAEGEAGEEAAEIPTDVPVQESPTEEKAAEEEAGEEEEKEKEKA